MDGWQSLIHPDDSGRVLASGRALLPSSLGVWAEEFRFRRADGSYAWVRVRSFVVRDEGRPSHVVGAMADISDVKRRDDELRAVPVLTERQRRVLAMLRGGSTNKEIAAALGIGEQAAKVQVGKLLRKFGVPNRAALAAAARDVS